MTSITNNKQKTIDSFNKESLKEKERLNNKAKQVYKNSYDTQFEKSRKDSK